MYINQDRKSAKIGKVQIDIKGNSYRLRFTYPKGKRNQLTLCSVSDEGWANALWTAHIINRDIDLGDVDLTFVRYSPKLAKSVEIPKPKQDSILELWIDYKEAKKHSIALTTQKHQWRLTDICLSKVSKEALRLNEVERLIDELLKIYSKGTLPRVLADLRAAAFFAKETGKIDNNPYERVSKYISKFQREARAKEIECFEDSEINAIIEAFKSDDKHKHYAPFIEFLARTAFRPEEATALTWEDIRVKNGITFIRVNKAFSKGILLPSTKNKTIRLFRCNESLIALLDSLPRSSDLVFPAPKGGYISHQNFRNRHWVKVLNVLVEQGKISQYLKLYCLRHSFITRQIRSGLDAATVGDIVGTSTEMIVKNYLAGRKDVEITDF